MSTARHTVAAPPPPAPRTRPGQDPGPGAGPERPAAAEEHWLEYEGFRYVCRVATSPAPVTEPLVVIGGMMQDRNSWTSHERPLRAHASVVTVELPGFGAADPLPAEYGYDFLAAALGHLLTELDTGPVNLLGTCYGGAVALRCAQRHPQHVARLMLGAMTGELPASYLEMIPEWRRLVAEDRRAELADSLLSTFVVAPDPRIHRHAAVWRMLNHQFRTQTPDDLAKACAHNARMERHAWRRPEVPAAPTLVYTGEHDHLTTPAQGLRLARELGAPFATLRDADHMFPLEQVAAHVDLIRSFCGDHPLTGLPYLGALEYPEGQDPV
ncbi:alpha/beta fold hydrolase [Streptomyces longwoodensis]|uniref:alpha/beta fold hydrolase n=1 Tax=Streptomyces longwoodensis TaxID=68231 RepID=UPI0033D1EA09